MDIKELIHQGTFPRNYRVHQTPASINPAIAYAMNQLAGLEENDQVLDPCFGTATILIERQLLMPCICIGVDINPKILDQAKENIETSNVIARSGSDHDAAISFNNAASIIVLEESSQPHSKKNPRKSISLKHSDIQDQKFPDGYFTKIISNLPYGIRSGSREKNIKLYRFLAEASQNWLQKNGKRDHSKNKCAGRSGL